MSRKFPPPTVRADYGFFINGRFLGILEAKKVTVNPQNVLEQAKRYARGATNGSGNWNGYHIPFLYASNGELIWHLDARQEKPVSRQLADFHTAPAMEKRFTFEAKPASKWLLDTPPEKIIRLRPYQVDAIAATERAVLAGSEMLLARACAGKLVPRNPNDEPAEQLLQRIRNQQTEPKPIKRKKQWTADPS